MMANKKPDFPDYGSDAPLPLPPSLAASLPPPELIWEWWRTMINKFKDEGIEPTEYWGSKIPNFSPEHGQPRPKLFILPIHKDKPRGMLIVCAGGAFLFKSNHEAKPVAEFFHQCGLNTAVLDYRVSPYTKTDSCLDALRAIRYLRYHAVELGILPDKIAIGGFSAGGMLSGMAGTLFDYGNPDAEEAIDRVSSRPDAVLLLYGAMSMRDGVGANGPRYDIEKENKIARMNNLKNLRFDCPPFFIFQTHSDDPRSSMDFGKELADRGIPFEVHTFREGPHGGGLYDGKDEHSPLFPHTAHWAELAAEWLEGYGF